jgi:hypothetical protein
MPQDRDILRERGKSLEDEFFRREDAKLVARLQEMRKAEVTRGELAKATGITKPEVLDRLMGLGIQVETLAALSIVPLVEVAWADGSLDAKERAAVLAHATEGGMTKGSPAYALLEAWLQHRPTPKLHEAWKQLVIAIRDQIGPEEASRLRGEILERARSVARASGGVLGMGSKVSSAEAAVLAELERPLA